MGLCFLRLAAQLKHYGSCGHVIIHLVEGVKCVGDLSVRFLWFNIVQKMTVSVSWHVLMHYGFVVQRGNL